MPGILRASISLDGKLLTAAGKPSRRRIPFARLRSAGELLLTIRPIIIGDDLQPTLSGLPEDFLKQELSLQLVSLKCIDGNLLARYLPAGEGDPLQNKKT
jgi:riboflavin biosynthesis pyrimidine reductase